MNTAVTTKDEILCRMLGCTNTRQLQEFLISNPPARAAYERYRDDNEFRKLLNQMVDLGLIRYEWEGRELLVELVE